MARVGTGVTTLFSLTSGSSDFGSSFNSHNSTFGTHYACTHAAPCYFSFRIFSVVLLSNPSKVIFNHPSQAPLLTLTLTTQRRLPLVIFSGLLFRTVLPPRGINGMASCSICGPRTSAQHRGSWCFLSVFYANPHRIHPFLHYTSQSPAARLTPLPRHRRGPNEYISPQHF